MVEKPINFYQSTERIATSGQPDREQIHSIAEQGYEVVINLATHDSTSAIPDEGSLVASLGMHYINIPVPFDEPTVSHLKEFIGILKVFEGKKVWIHCEVNARVSAFMFHYLTKVAGFSVSSASSPVMIKWRPKMDNVWQDFIAITKSEISL
jgi:protein tyrosine phosphatase (PTP) superfamily phosphohydrolase (DUF442 family)